MDNVYTLRRGDRSFTMAAAPAAVSPRRGPDDMCRLAVLACLLCLPVGPGVAAVEIAGRLDSPQVRFGVAEILRSAREKGVSPDSLRLRVERGGEAVEGFTLQGGGVMWTIRASDARGAMYGCLELAEQILLKASLAAVNPVSQSPRLARRAFKFNIPLPGTLYLSEEDLDHNQWFWDLEYWREFFDMAARNRYNAVTFWSAHPYDRMVKLAKYPEANSLPRTELEQNIKFFHALFRLAADRGLETYLITWNIHVSPAFAQAHHLPEAGFDSPLVRDYTRECIRQLLQDYPELTGIGTTQGERMSMEAPERAKWIADVYFPAIRASGRRDIPFILRYWGGEPESTEKALAGYQGPVYLDIKYNGEHMYSSTRYHVADGRWLQQQPRHYKLFWHLRNDDLYILRWGDPEFVRALVRIMAATDAIGFVEGSEIDVPGPDRIHTPQTRGHLAWKYKYEKFWLRFALWGRLGYNPDLADDVWIGHFTARFGRPAGETVFQAVQAVSRITPTVTSYHWNYMNGDWYPEGSIGSWNTSAEQPRRNYRRVEMYHSIYAWVFNNTIDGGLENPVEFAARVLRGGARPVGVESPLDIAAALERNSREALAAITRADAAVAPANKEYQCTRLDLEAYARLGLYYAEKLRGVAELSLFLFGGGEKHQNAAVEHLEQALKEWELLARITAGHYIRHEVWLFDQFDWGMYTPAVREDIALARQARPWVSSAGIVTFDQAGMGVWLLYVASLLKLPVADRVSSEPFEITLPAAEAQSVVPPLTRTKATLRVPSNYQPPARRVFTGSDAELGEEATARFVFQVPAAGSYQVELRARWNQEPFRGIFASVDLEHSRRMTISPTVKTPGEWQWASSSHTVALGPGTHTLRLKLPGAGTELESVRILRAAEASKQ